MVFILTTGIFLLCLLFLLPLSEMFLPKYLRSTVNTILSRPKPASMTTSTILKKIYPLIRWMIILFRIDGYAPRWKRYKEYIRVAGLEKDLGVEQFIGIKYLVSTTILSYLLLVSLANFSFDFLLLGTIMSFVGFFLPDQWIKIRVKKRQWEIQKELPSVLISLAVTTDAGLSLFQALEEVCQRKKGALTEELSKTIQEVAVGIPQKEAFESMANRVLVEELTVFISALIQTIEKGSSGLPSVLREQANTAWSKRKSKAKELGEKASIKLFLPLITLILPALMIFLITPAIFSILKFFVY